VGTLWEFRFTGFDRSLPRERRGITFSVVVVSRSVLFVVLHELPRWQGYAWEESFDLKWQVTSIALKRWELVFTICILRWGLDSAPENFPSYTYLNNQ